MAAKDLRLAAGGGQGLVQAVLLGLLLIFLFSLSRPTTELVSPQAAAANPRPARAITVTERKNKARMAGLLWIAVVD